MVPILLHPIASGFEKVSPLLLVVGSLGVLTAIDFYYRFLKRLSTLFPLTPALSPGGEGASTRHFSRQQVHLSCRKIVGIPHPGPLPRVGEGEFSLSNL